MKEKARFAGEDLDQLLAVGVEVCRSRTARVCGTFDTFAPVGILLVPQ
jgi:hypothetical protein